MDYILTPVQQIQRVIERTLLEHSVLDLSTFLNLMLSAFFNLFKSVNNPGRSVSSGTLTQAIRNFAKSLEGWLTNAMTNFPHEIIRTKVTRSFLSLQQLLSSLYPYISYVNYHI